MDSVDWDEIREALPIRKTPEDFEKRNKLWAAVDENGNGFVSLAELDKKFRELVKVDRVFKAQPVLIRAHQAARFKVKTKSIHGPDYVERCEFRLVLLYIRQYFEYYVAFKRIDKSNDDRISLAEFVNAGEELNKWIPNIGDLEEAFKEADANGGGMILFNEFVRWAIKRSLDLEDDDDYDLQG